MNILIIIIACIMSILSLIHFYWVFGGKWGLESSIPNDFHAKFFNEKNETKNKIATLVVAFGLIGLAFIISLNYTEIENQILTITSRVIGAVFILRAIGDFNMFGLFKKKSNSKFSQSDTILFVPLCLFIGISCILISL